MDEADFVIRTATPGDATAVASLATELGFTGNRAEIADRLGRILKTPGHCVMVAETTENKIVGWIHVFGTVRLTSESFAELGGLVVAESWRGRGVGARLVASSEQWALENGQSKLRIRSREERTGAHSFFQRLGFIGFKTQQVFERSLTRDRTTEAK